MKKMNALKKSLLLLAPVAMFTACGTSDREKIENREESKVGHIYNRDIQGPDVENHANQFYISRIDTKDTTMVPMQNAVTPESMEAKAEVDSTNAAN